jgi:glutamyl-tRNA synthetase
MKWTPPAFAHIPLIHGPDGTKLSKRHGALGVDAYRDMGYLPEALRNYLLRLGWSHGDAETIETGQAIEWFDLDAVGRSPARFDFAKLDNLNGHYLREADDTRLVELVMPRLMRRLGRPVDAKALPRIHLGMAGLKARAKTVEQLADDGLFYVQSRPIPLDAKAAALLDAPARRRLAAHAAQLAPLLDWRPAALEAATRDFAAGNSLKLGQVAQPLRAALTGSTVSPPVFEVMAALGRHESLARLGDVAHSEAAQPAG